MVAGGGAVTVGGVAAGGVLTAAAGGVEVVGGVAVTAGGVAPTFRKSVSVLVLMLEEIFKIIMIVLFLRVYRSLDLIIAINSI